MTAQLLRQPGGFEGFLSIKKDPYAQELAVFEVVEVRKRLSLCKAALGLQIQYQERQNAVGPKRPQPLDLHLESRRPLINGLEKVPDPRFTTVGPVDSRDWVDQLKIGVTEGEVRVNVPVVDGGDARLAISTFSCDIAYSDSPAASRASAWVRKSRMRAIFPSRNSMSSPSSWLNSMPVARAVRSI